jgi:hypothetical protein
MEQFKSNRKFLVESTGSDDGVQHSELLGFWTLSIFRNSK